MGSESCVYVPERLLTRLSFQEYPKYDRYSVAVEEVKAVSKKSHLLNYQTAIQYFSLMVGMGLKC